MVHFEGVGHKKSEILRLTFEVLFFFNKTQKIIFFKVTMTIGENTLIKCLQCIKYDNS